MQIEVSVVVRLEWACLIFVPAWCVGPGDSVHGQCWLVWVGIGVYSSFWRLIRFIYYDWLARFRSFCLRFLSLLTSFTARFVLGFLWCYFVVDRFTVFFDIFFPRGVIGTFPTLEDVGSP